MKVFKRVKMIAMVLVMVFLAAPMGMAGVHTEDFSDYSGYDPYKSTAKWNVHDQRLEIHPIANPAFGASLKTLDAGGGHYFELYIGPHGDSYGVFLQEYDMDGYPVHRAPGLLLKSNMNYFNMDAAVLTGGDIMLVWTDDDYLNIWAQRFNRSGDAAWSPVRVNHTPVGSQVWSLKVASLPENESVVAFIDDRNGNNRAFVQRILSAGSPAWAADVQLQNMIFATESSIRVGTDDFGNIIVGWLQLVGADYDVGFTRVDLDGNVAWDPARIANLDTTHAQNSLVMRVAPGDGIYFGWREYTGAVYRMELQKWFFDGTCATGSDFNVLSDANNLGHASMHILSTGNILLILTNTIDHQNIMLTAVFSPDFDILATPQLIYGPTTMWLTGSVSPASSKNGGALITWNASGDYTFENRMMMLGNLGQALWPDYRTIDRGPGFVMRAYNYFTENSGNAGGFKYAWTDSRAGDFHAFGAEYLSPLQPNQVAKQFDMEVRTLAAKTAQAPDGTVVTLQVVRTPEGIALKFNWCDSHFTPMWKEPVTIAEFPFTIGLSSFDVDVDSLGRAIICWTQNGDPLDQGVFFQAITNQRQQVHATPVRVDSGLLVGSFRQATLEPVGAGDAIVTWVDDVVGDYHVLAQRIGSNGAHVWPSLLQVTTVAPDYIVCNDLVTLSDRMVAIYTSSTGSDYVVSRGEFTFNGANISMPSPISNNYNYIDESAAEAIGDDVYVVWTMDDSGQNRVMGQKLVGGLPNWIDKEMSDTTYDGIYELDIINTDTNKLCYAFQGSQGISRWTLIQEFDTSGTTTYTAERIMISPEPAVYNFQYGISAQLNIGEDVHWASVAAAEDDPRGGEIQYWLSNDGGTNWIQTEVGLPVVFPTSGNDLRVSADLYAEYYQQVSPYVTSMTTMWNESQIATDLVLNQSHYYAGDNFRLSLRHSNSGASVIVDKYLMLDVYGLYWFWPGWTETLDFAQDSISSGYTEDVIFEFPWPGDTGVATDLRFWTALLDPGTGELVGPWDYVTFGYGP